MQTGKIFFLLGFSFLFLVQQGHAAAGGLARVAVVEFDNKAGADPAIVSSFTDMLVTGIVKSGKFNVVERGAVAKVVKEQNFGDSGAVEGGSAAKMGKLLGAEYLVVGVVTEVNDGKGGGGALGGLGIARNKSSLAVDVRFVDCSSGEVRFADTFREERSSTAVAAGGAGFNIQQGAGAEMARALIDKLNQRIMMSVYPPTVVKLDSGTGEVALNYGDMMFKLGEHYDVFAQGDDIKDPATGKKIGNMESKVGEVEIISVQPKLSQGKIISGQAPEGSVVRKSTGEGKKQEKGGGLFKRKK